MVRRGFSPSFGWVQEPRGLGFLGGCFVGLGTGPRTPLASPAPKNRGGPILSASKGSFRCELFCSGRVVPAVQPRYRLASERIPDASYWLRWMSFCCRFLSLENGAFLIHNFCVLPSHCCTHLYQFDSPNAAFPQKIHTFLVTRRQKLQ